MVAGIQGRVSIEIQGPRLNRSKDERAGMVYGNDHRLSWNVTAPMPKLVVSQYFRASLVSIVLTGLSKWSP